MPHTLTNRDYLSSFGRNRGRKLRAHQQSLVDTLLPKLAVTPSLCHPRASGDPEKKIALEIGFGSGEHLAALAERHPDTLCIGAEPYLNGVAKLLAAVDAQKLDNIRIFMGDARELVDALPEHCVDDVYILFPDPWPKARQQKRRLVNHDTLKRLSRIHKPGGALLLATDHRDYATWMLEHLLDTPYYDWSPESAHDWQTPPAEWVETKYERKTSAEGRDPLFFKCRRK